MTPCGASTIPATQTASSSEKCSSSPAWGKVSTNWEPSATAPPIRSSAKAPRSDSGNAHEAATAPADAAGRDDAGDQHPGRRSAGA